MNLSTKEQVGGRGRDQTYVWKRSEGPDILSWCRIHAFEQPEQVGEYGTRQRTSLPEWDYPDQHSDVGDFAMSDQTV